MSTVAGAVPDHVLETHLCRLCQRYLTVGPISAHPDGGSVCGRCQRRGCRAPSLFECDSISDQVSIPYALFGYVNHLFPCVNRYEGCARLLPFAEVGPHEALCRPRKSACARCGYEGAGSQLLHHFRTLHPGNFLDTGRFRLPLKRATNLVKRGEELFLLHVDLDDAVASFRVEPTGLLRDDVDFFCLLKDPLGEVLHQTTSTRRGKAGIYHRIFIKEGYLDLDVVHCDCLLRRVKHFSKKVFL